MIKHVSFFVLFFLFISFAGNAQKTDSVKQDRYPQNIMA
jgi:hypothetical protein